jgi:hypothetical protein
MKNEMMVEFVWQQQRRELWSTDRPGEGVVLKKARGEYVCAPRSLESERGGFFDAIRAMNVRVSDSLPPASGPPWQATSGSNGL